MEQLLDRNGVHAGNVTRNSKGEFFGEMMEESGLTATTHTFNSGQREPQVIILNLLEQI